MSFEDKQLTFGGAGGGILGPPWGVLGSITARALEPLGYRIAINGDAWGPFNPRMMAAGEVDFGATRASNALAAYRGKHQFDGEEPRTNLRAIAAIQHPTWEAVAVRWETGISSLADIRDRQLPVRVVGGESTAARIILESYGLSRQLIESWGGKFQGSPPAGAGNIRTQFSWVRGGDYDLIMGAIFSGYGPEVWQLLEASILHNLRFLPLADHAVRRLCEEEGGQQSMLPHHLLRGLDRDVPSVMRMPQIVYGRDDMPESFAYTVARALDEHSHLFREVYLAYSYDWRAVGLNTGIPLHPGAAQYYREKGYPMQQFDA
ncbi:MAG: hypothetical protein KGJ86_05950 [Chloroflexota bacterium]|nr:hypothetical protein [Chloroflexota bacterium]